MSEQHPGLHQRNGWWHIDHTISVGRRKKRLREATGFRQESLQEARAHLQRRIEEVQRELSDPLPRIEHTFQDAAIQYVLHLERRGKDPARAEQDLTLLDPHIGDLPVSHVHQGALAPFDLAMQRRGLRSSTVARAYRTTTAVLNHAARVLRDGPRPWLTQAPPKLTAPDWGDQLPPYRLTWDEQDRLLNALTGNHKRAHLLGPVAFALATGARQQEICQLAWAWEMHIDGLPKGSVWRIPPGVRKANARKSASQQQARYLVCNATARRLIDAQRDNRSALVFPGPKGQAIGVLNNTAWRTAWRKAKLPTEGVKMGVHNLRHTYGERLDAVGTPWPIRKAIMGHEIGDVTALYAAPGLAQMLEWAEKVTRTTAPVLRPVAVAATQTRHKQKSGPKAALSN